MLVLAAALIGNTHAHHVKVSPEEILPVQVKMWMITEVDFPKGSEIVATGSGRPRYGDPKFWEVSTDRNALYIRPQDDPLPVGGGRSTTINITLTDGRRFQILAQEVSKEKGAHPDYHIIAETEDTDQAGQVAFVHADALKGLQAENEVLHRYCDSPQKTSTIAMAPAALKSSEVDALNGLHFFDYEVYDVKGRAKNFQRVIFHNERFTFVALNGLEAPTVSALRDGKFAKVEAAWVKNRWELPLLEEGMVEVGKDHFKFRLRSTK